jgi:probable phosphoglycerate mutase
MNTSTELILIRHGETVWNLENRWQGHQDSDSSPLGLQQIRAVAERMAKVPFDALYTSDLPRAYRMAEAVAAITGRPMIGDPTLRERKLGIFEGLTLAEIREQHPAAFEGFISRDPHFVIPGGESLEAKHDRAVQAFERIVHRHPGQRVVLVTHGGILDSAFRLAVGLSRHVPRKWVLYNGSVNVITHRDGGWILNTWGDVSHLRQTGTLDDY